MGKTTTREIAVICKDNIPISATVYQPIAPAVGAVMIGPATGIKRQFYGAFAT